MRRCETLFLKKWKKTGVFLFLSLFMIPFPALAYSEYLIPGGENIGIQIESKGIMVVGVYEVNGSYPATDAGFQIGDLILKVNQEKVNSIDDMVQKISAQKESKIAITYSRAGTMKTTNLSLYTDTNGVYKTGLYVKDSITGLGTLSFIDPETKLFGALGHEITEKNSGFMLEVKDGKIFDTSVTTIDRSETGAPGSKNAELYYDQVEGTIKENTKRGIFGTYTGELPNKKTYKVANPNDIKVGKATILTVLKNQEIKEYEINILKINKNDKENKNILFEVTDPDLLEITGGVVQGMSGSSILQGDYIIGAVTHVVIDNPKHGYGIFITKMLEEAEN